MARIPLGLGMTVGAELPPAPPPLKAYAGLADRSDVSQCIPKAKLSLAAMLACVALAMPAKAQQYSFRYYGIEEGLTNLAVKVLFQDRTGFLWAGTENGVFRFDGQGFQRYGPDEGLPHEVILSLGEAPDGSILAGYRRGVYRQKGRRFEPVGTAGSSRR